MFLHLKCVIGKVGLGFNPNNKKRSVSKPFLSFFEEQSIDLLKQPLISCFYYMKRGHFIRFCKAKRFFVPKDILKWAPKDSNVPKVPTNIIGPKFIKGPNLAS